MKIKQVQTKKEFKQFIALPQKIYRAYPCWVPKLNMDIKHLLSDKNPFYDHSWRDLFIVYDGNEPVGRIAAIIDKSYNEFHDEKTGYFGFFECIADKGIAGLLLERCERALKEQGMEKIVGPMNPSSNDECGFLIDGFESPPRLMMPYNPQYYIEFMNAHEYKKAKDLFALNVVVDTIEDVRLKKIVDKIKSRYPGYSCRCIDMKNFKNDVEYIRRIYNRAWEKNWGFVPWTDAQLNDMAKQLKPLVVPEMILLAFHDNEPVGFLLCMPDYNEIIKKIGRNLFPTGWLKFLRLKGSIQNIRLMAMGVVKEFQSKGAGPLLYYYALKAAKEKGYKECEYSWILEDNHETLKIARMMGAEVYKTYRIYDKPLS